MAQSIKIGDTVTVPGDMFGTVKFLGTVLGKKGTFAGVQLAPEFAARGKNSGDVDGKRYFTTSIPGSGIFLPVEKAIKRPSLPGTASPSTLRSPGTPTRLTSFNIGGRTPGTAGRPNFSQSVSAAGHASGLRAGAASPALKPNMRRESLPRPQSPLRKAASPQKSTLATPRTRPGAAGFAKSQLGGPGGYRSGGPKPSLGGNKFSQSLRTASTATTLTTQSEETLGPESNFDEVPEEEAEHTPTPTPNLAGSKKIDRESDRVHKEEMARLQSLLDQKDQALRDQHSSIAEMERNLIELQKLVPELSEDGPPPSRSRMQQEIEDEDLPKDVAALRGALREKNEKIKLLTAEFDANRADFRSTIDTLEMASTETERVYEKRVDELLEEVRHLQDRSEDVESVALQLKQLEELVQELEEGLEDARRGEAEARGEVEFLRGEVERSRSELRRERERKRAEEQLNGYDSEAGASYDTERVDELQSQLDGKEDEIRGLKTIIRNLQAVEAGTVKANGIKNIHSRDDSADVRDGDGNRLSMQQQIRDLEALLQQKSAHEEELTNEVTKLRNSVHLGKIPLGGSNAFGIRSGANGYNSRPASKDINDLKEKDKHVSTGTQGSQRTVVLSPTSEHLSGENQWHDANEQTASPSRGRRGFHDTGKPGHARNESDTEVKSDASGSSAALWCEICEESGHDILSCKNMIGSGTEAVDEKSHVRNKESKSMPAPLMSRKTTKDSVQTITGSNAFGSASTPPDEPLPPPPPAKDSLDDAKRELKMPVEGTGAQAGMWAGKSSGTIDPDKWCALCERDGHESVDCPIEDAF
jgi:hypothetical protein